LSVVKVGGPYKNKVLGTILAVLVLASLMATPVMHVKTATSEGGLDLENIIQVSDLPNYPKWEWHIGFKKVEEDLITLPKIEEMFAKANYVFVPAGVMYEGKYYAEFTWPSKEKPYIINGELIFDELTTELAKKWEDTYGEYPLPKEALFLAGTLGMLKARIRYIPFENVEIVQNVINTQWDVEQLEKEGIVVTDSLIMEDLETASKEEANELLELFLQSVSEVQGGIIKTEKLIDTENTKVVIGQGVDVCPPLEISYEYRKGEEKLYLSGENTSVCYYNTGYIAFYMIWFYRRLSSGYVTGLIYLAIANAISFDLKKDEWDYVSLGVTSWLLYNLIVDPCIPVASGDPDYPSKGCIQNDNFNMIFIPEEDPWDILPSPEDILDELEAGLYRLMSKFGGVGASETKAEPMPVPEIPIPEIPEEDYVRVEEVSPKEGEVLIPGKSYDIHLKVGVGLYSADEAVLKVSIYALLPGKNVSLMEPDLIDVVGKGEDAGDLYYTIDIPTHLRNVSNEVIIELALIPSDSKEPTATAIIRYPSYVPKVKLSYELSKDYVIANGEDTVEIIVRAIDEDGNPVKDRELVASVDRGSDLNWLSMEPNLMDYGSACSYFVKLYTDSNGEISFHYKAPKVVKSYYPVITKSNDPFPIYDTIVVKDVLTGDSIRIRVKLISPYPKIEKASISQPVWADTWAKISVLVQDIDSDTLYVTLMSTIPGTFDYKGKMVEGGKIDFEVSSGDEFNVGFRSIPIGLDVRNIPKVSDMLKSKLKDALLSLIPNLISERANIAKAYTKLEKFMKAKGVPVISSKKIAQYLAWGDEKFTKAISKLVKKAGYDEKAAQALIKYMKNDAIDRALLINDWFGTEETLGGNAWKYAGDVEAYMRGDDVSKLGLYLDGVYILMGIGGLFEDGTMVAKALKLGAWEGYFITVGLNTLYGFKELYDKYREIGDAVTKTFPAGIIVLVKDSEGHTTHRYLHFFILHYARGGAGLDEALLAGGESSEVVSTLVRYYEACKEEDMDAYLSTLNTNGMSQDELQLLIDMTKAFWNATSTLTYDISDIEVGILEGGERAAVTYRVSGVLEFNGEEISLEYDAIAILSKVSGEWKIDNLMIAQQFYETLAYVTLMDTVLEERVSIATDAVEELPRVRNIDIQSIKTPPETESIKVYVGAEVLDSQRHVVTGVFKAPNNLTYITRTNMSSLDQVAVLDLPMYLVKGEPKGLWYVDIYVDDIWVLGKYFTVGVEETSPMMETTTTPPATTVPTTEVTTERPQTKTVVPTTTSEVISETSPETTVATSEAEVSPREGEGWGVLQGLIIAAFAVIAVLAITLVVIVKKVLK